MKLLLQWLSLTVVALLTQTPQVDAQPASQTGTLVVTVVDPSGLVIPNAVVTAVGVDEATKKIVIAPVKSSEKGIATFDRLPLGRYTVGGEFPGFEIGAIRDLPLKAGANKHVLVLPMAKMTEEITVGRDPQTVASNRASTFGSALTREQIDTLSDDPDEMARQLQDMAGSGATMRIDSFEGGQLPPKAQIKAIHITRDAFAAENHASGGMFIDVITQPGLGALRGMVRLSVYDSALDGANPLVPKKGPAQSQNLGVTFSGPFIKNRGSFSLYLTGARGYRTPNLYAATPAGTVAQNLALSVPTDWLNVNAYADYALTNDQTLRVTINRNVRTAKNLGVGAYDLVERAYATENRNFSLRLQEAGPIGRRLFINTRCSMLWSDAESTSAVEAPTIAVLDAFTGGGAQRDGGRHTRTYSLQSDLDYIKGIHSWRIGVAIDGGTYRSDDTSNYLGTYTFASLADYQAGQPQLYTRRIGNPSISYSNWQAGLYIQDDIRISKNLTLSPGVRFEFQTHVKNWHNIGPRAGITWSPFKSGKTTLRASAGRFFDWLNSGTYEQTLRVDGLRQQELTVMNPAYPDPGSPGLVPPISRYLVASGMRLAENTRMSFGVEQQIGKVLRANTVYSDIRGRGLLVGRNLNPPIDGIRPDPVMANIIEAAPDGRSRSRSLTTSLSLNLSPPSIGPATTGPVFVWRRGLAVEVGYGWAKSENNVDGAFSQSPTGTLATEWGPSNADSRRRASVSLSSTALKGLNVYVSLEAASGRPYTIRTGSDDNRDQIFNDRPSGVGRNTERAAGAFYSWAVFSYTVGFGKKKVPAGIGVVGKSGGLGGYQLSPVAMADQKRYRLQFSLMVDNITNHPNYSGYSGVMTSPFFKKPTMVDGVRTFNLGVSLSF